MSLHAKNYFRLKNPEGLFWDGEISKNKYPTFSKDGELIYNIEALNNKLSRYELFRLYFPSVPKLTTVSYVVGIIEEQEKESIISEAKIQSARIEFLQPNKSYYGSLSRFLNNGIDRDALTNLLSHPECNEFLFMGFAKPTTLTDEEKNSIISSLDRPCVYHDSVAVRSMKDLIYFKIVVGDRFKTYMDLYKNPFPMLTKQQQKIHNPT
jgi:hypothetical protein